MKKAFTEEFYERVTSSHLQPVLDTLEYLKNETDVWFEITTLLIPGENDSEKEIREMSQWIRDHLGTDVPIHFSAFHPDFKMRDHPATPEATLIQAREIAQKIGIQYVYTGNIHHKVGDSTYCPECHKVVIERDWYELGEYHIKDNGCSYCGAKIAGILPDQAGVWGRKRQPVHLEGFKR